MNKTTINNLIFMLQKLPCDGHTIHEKNNLLTTLNMIKTKKVEHKKLEKRCLDFIIKQSKKAA